MEKIRKKEAEKDRVEVSITDVTGMGTGSEHKQAYYTTMRTLVPILRTPIGDQEWLRGSSTLVRW